MDLEDISVLIKIAGLQFDKISNSVLTDYDLTPTQFKIVRFLMLSPYASVRQIDIEQRFSITNPTVTGVLQNLEKKGLIKRIPNPNDGRSKIVIPTDKLKDKNREIEDIFSLLESRFTSSLEDDEKAQLRALLKKMLEK